MTSEYLPNLGSNEVRKPYGRETIKLPLGHKYEIVYVHIFLILA